MIETTPAEFCNKDNMEREIIDSVMVTGKCIIPHRFDAILSPLYSECQRVVKEMLSDRTKNSSKHWKTVPCVVSKSLIAKYQRNPKCQSVKKLAIQICGDKGRQVKLIGNQIRIPSIFKKEWVDIFPPKPIGGNISSVEIFKRKGKWFLSYSYLTPTNIIQTCGVIGVDRNARGNVATVCDIQTGKVIKVGPDIKGWKDNFKNRKRKLQRKGAKSLLKKINRKQSNRTKDINHKCAKSIVDYATKHCRAIVLENLKNIKDSKKCGHYTKKSNWSYFQLEQFLKYKAALRNIPIYYVDPFNTSKKCSRCGTINDVNGKKFVCKSCGHKDHRDSNAGFNIGSNYLRGITENQRKFSAGRIDASLTGKGEGVSYA